jgi:hypothetical protein
MSSNAVIPHREEKNIPRQLVGDPHRRHSTPPCVTMRRSPSLASTTSALSCRLLYSSAVTGLPRVYEQELEVMVLPLSLSWRHHHGEPIIGAGEEVQAQPRRRINPQRSHRVLSTLPVLSTPSRLFVMG